MFRSMDHDIDMEEGEPLIDKPRKYCKYCQDYYYNESDMTSIKLYKRCRACQRFKDGGQLVGRD